MKKIILILISVLWVNMAMGQNTHFGLKLGLNASNLKYENRSASDYKAGLHVGGLAHIHISEHFAFQPELVYSNQGGKQTISKTVYDLDLNYFTIPLLAQYMFGDGFRVQAGPQVGLLISAKREHNKNEVNIKKDYDTGDVSLAAGLSYVTESGLGADFRWVFGLTSINDVPGRAATRNNVGQVGIFYLLNYGSGSH